MGALDWAEAWTESPRQLPVHTDVEEGGLGGAHVDIAQVEAEAEADEIDQATQTRRPHLGRRGGTTRGC